METCFTDIQGEANGKKQNYKKMDAGSILSDYI